MCTRETKLSCNAPPQLCLVTDGAKTVGTGFILIQYINDKKPEKGINIINAMLVQDYSAVEAEEIALDRAMLDTITGCIIVKR